MDVSLPPELERRVLQTVEAGRYPNASDVVQEALRRFFAMQDDRAGLLAELDADIRLGLDQAEAGMLVQGSMAFAEVTRRIEARRGS